MPRLHADHSRLSGDQRQRFGEVLLDAFDLDTFDNLLANRLGLRRQRISLARSFDSIVYDVIDDAEMKSYSAELLQAARSERQSHIGLFRFAQEFDLEPSLAAPERLVRAHLGELDPEPWLTLALERLGQVCRIAIPAAGATGTGFLIGADLLLTNHHVMEQAIAHNLSGRFVQLYFDQRLKSDRYRVAQVHTLAASNWLIDASPNSDQPYEQVGLEALDYALLRLEKRAGDETVDSAAGKRRGWIPLPPIPPVMAPPVMAPDAPLLLLGHPRGEALKLTLDTQALISVNAAGSRLRYRTNSELGSSGSPCFDLHWNLVALHHAGDPVEPPARPQWNEGIPLAAIRQAWQGKLSGSELSDEQRRALAGLMDDGR
jgi:hypothetical protein